jgi:hypothetical protein
VVNILQKQVTVLLEVQEIALERFHKSRRRSGEQLR